MSIEISMSDTTINNLLITIGNGSKENGYARLVEICDRLNHARSKHPKFADNKKHGSDVIFDECLELMLAVKCETPERQHDEVLDVITTAIRFANREYKKEL